MVHHNRVVTFFGVKLRFDIRHYLRYSMSDRDRHNPVSGPVPEK